jgi:lysophospholipase L1-like esterase
MFILPEEGFPMSPPVTARTFFSLMIVASALVHSTALASTITQNTSWTIDRAGTTTNLRVVAYGDSIYAGYNGSLSAVARRAAPWVDGEYLSAAQNVDVEVIRRTKSGAVASDIYNSKIVAEASYMQTSNTRVVTMEMCGNDGLQARSSFVGQSGTCNYGALETAMANCTTYMEAAMQYINANASPTTELKIIANLYYPGYDADNGLATCTDPVSGQRPNKQDIFLPYIARMNWRACNFADAYDWACVDSFAEYMGADFDTNGDGQTDSEALAYVNGESEDAYVTRITQTLRSTLRDSNFHRATAGTSYDYIQSDDTHPTYTGNTINVGFFGGTGSGSGAPDFPNISGGKNPVWNQYGHERMGWSLSTHSVTPTTTTTTSSTTTSTSTTTTSSSSTTTLPPTCIADGAGKPCTETTNCCSGVGNCTGGKASNRVCAATPAICGDGTVDAGEDCEPGVALGDTCQTLGFSDGSLACGGDCQYDTTGCSGAPACGGGGDACSSDVDCCSNNCNTRRGTCR